VPGPTSPWTAANCGKAVIGERADQHGDVLAELSRPCVAVVTGTRRIWIGAIHTCGVPEVCIAHELQR